MDVRLQLVADPWRGGKVLPDLDVVLHVDAGLDVAVGDVRIADPPRVVARLIGQIGLEVVERVSAEIVRGRIRTVPAAVEQNPRA